VSGTNGLSGSFNYARNSVKATIDAYDGTVHFYVVDKKDPIVQSWREAFPVLFSDFSAMPTLLKDHLRYPEDLFRVQAEVFARYHVVESRRFFQGSERWLISPDPTDAISATSALTGGSSGGSSSSSGGRAPEIKATSKRQDPYYLYIRLPGDERESFLMLQSFVPVSQNNQQLRLVSFLTAKSDLSDYGKIESFVMPQGQTVDGPVQAALKINQQPDISARFTLLDQSGSKLIKGNIQLIPVGNSIVYVEPIYIEGEGTSRFPIYQFVAVYAQGRDPVLAPDVNAALDQIFPSTAGQQLPSTPSTPSTPGAPSTPSTPSTVTDLLTQAAQRFTDADTALRAGDLGKYQSLVKEAQSLVAQAQQLLNQGSTATPLPSASTTTTKAR
jgi:uncharacterized membrane protein (UPF0182 family)